MNLTFGSYPYFSYIPSTYAAAIFSGLVFLSLIIWLVQSIQFSCRPCVISILIFISHLLMFSELVLRATLTIEERNTEPTYKFTTALISISSQMLLASNFQCLIEMRGNMKNGPIDIVAAIIVPIGMIGSGTLLGIAKKYSFIPEKALLSFCLRQISVGIVILYIVLLFVFWHFNVINVRRRYIKPLLIITSICLFIDAIFAFASSIPSLFSLLNEHEFWFYIGHLIPTFIAHIIWSLLYWRTSPIRSHKNDGNADNRKNVLLPTSTA